MKTERKLIVITSDDRRTTVSGALGEPLVLGRKPTAAPPSEEKGVKSPPQAWDESPRFLAELRDAFQGKTD